MSSLTTGQFHDLLVQFTQDYPEWTIHSIRMFDSHVIISCLDVTGEYRRVKYEVRIYTDFVKADA